MLDLAAQKSRARPFAGRQLAIESGQVDISPAPVAARFSLRCRPEHVDAFGEIFVPLPVSACRATVVGARAALWLGPDEWLLLAEDGTQDAVREAFASIAHATFSLVDISHRDIGISVAGPAAAEVLSAGCPLDLDPDVLSAGSCTRTLFGKCEIVLWRPSAQEFRIYFGRSYADYVWRLLDAACADVATSLRA